MRRMRLLIHAATFLGRVWKLARPYWFSEERWRARGLLAAIVALSLGLVYLTVVFNQWNRDFYNALEQKNAADASALLLYFGFLAAVYIAGAIYQLYLQQMLEMRWRVWLTKQYLGDWLTDRTYYRLELSHGATDNPDQRIAEDLRNFTQRTLSLSLGLLSQSVTLASFLAILWNVSGPITFSLAGHVVTIPGYMLWCALVYALLGSVLTHYVGRRLIPLNFLKERLEADFRFSLVRVRENAEGVALYRGENSESTSLLTRFERIRANWWQIIRYTKHLTAFTNGYTQIALIFPFLVAFPRFFSGAISLGQLMQIASAFGQVQSSLSWLVNNYSDLAEWKAGVDRLLTFNHAIEEAKRAAVRADRIVVAHDAESRLEVQNLHLERPDGHPIVSAASFAIRPGERLLVTGPSGAGKSTLFRGIAGIWPFGTGRVDLPARARVLFLPQKPYIPIASLRDALTYPAAQGTFSDAELSAALRDCRLAAFVDRLNEVAHWSMTMSVGEQQRLAVARALLHKPDWLFLDEATAALDETTERELYEMLRVRLPESAIVSIAHRPTVAVHHTRRLELAVGGTTTQLVAA
jgi:vitamin B12/bleomycin/antimicrobial peptide transport system ATP-binding/permease protein